MYRFVHLEDEPLDAALVEARLEEAGLTASIRVAATEAAFAAALREGPVDLVLADLELPGYNGRHALELVRLLRPEVPFIFVTGKVGEEDAVALLKSGATDYVLKTALHRLGSAVKRALQEADERRARAAAEAAMAAEHEWLRVTLGSIGDAVIATDRQGRVTFMNAVAEALTGWPQAEAAGQPVEGVYVVHDEATGEAVAGPVASLLRAAQPEAGAAPPTRLRRRDGTLVAIEANAAPIRAGDGRLLGVVLVFRDVTQRRLAERAANQTARLQQVTAALAPSLTAAAVTRVIVDQSLAALNASASAVYLASEDGQWLHLAASQGYPEAVQRAVGRLPVTADLPGPQVFGNGEAMWLGSHAELAARYPGLANRRGSDRNEAIAVLPLKAGGQALGVLALSFDRPRRFEPDERRFLLALAGQCAQALERAHLHEVERRARARAEASEQRLAVLAEASARLAASLDVQATLQTVVRLLLPRWADYCGVFLVDEAGRVYPAGSGHVDPAREPLVSELNTHYAAAVGDANNLLGRVLRTGLTVRGPHLPRPPQPTPPGQERLWALVAQLAPVAVMGVPLMAHGRALGALMLAMAEPGRTLADDEMPMLEELARRAALALDNARLYEAAQEFSQALEQRVAARTAELLRSEATFQALVNSVHDYAIFMLDPQGCIASWNPGAERIKGYSAKEIIGQPLALFYPPEELARGYPQRGLEQALATGHFEAEGWRVRRDGSRFWAHVVITPVRSEAGELLGYAKVTRDLTEHKRMEEELGQSHAQVRKLSAHLEAVREQERARVAREIHDELGGLLTGLKMDAAQVRNRLEPLRPEAAEKFAVFSQSIDHAVKTVRRIASELRPAVLDDFGLLAALEWQLEEFSRRSDMTCEWHSQAAEAAVELPPEHATAVFRVFQESLTNIARHSRATRVAAHVSVAAGALQLEVHDNGVGIRLPQTPGTGSLGLVGMRERILQIGGSLTIDAPPEGGTRVVVSVPMPPEPTA